jgi:hypothetical protein
MNKIPYEERVKTYTNALLAYGETKQCIVAIEELSECAKELCKVLRGKGNPEHLAEEVADATICLEQIRLFFGINDKVCQYMDEKVQRLDERMRKLSGEIK